MSYSNYGLLGLVKMFAFMAGNKFEIDPSLCSSSEYNGSLRAGIPKASAIACWYYCTIMLM
jgi:hypothetical protein